MVEMNLLRPGATVEEVIRGYISEQAAQYEAYERHEETIEVVAAM